MADLGKKISELQETTDLAGLFTIGTDKNTQSKKVSLQFLKEAADYANSQGDYAKEVGDTVAGNVGVNAYPTFSASTQYAAGSVVNYNGKLYRFTSLHPAGAWVGTDAVLTSIKAEADLKLTELESELRTSTQEEFDEITERVYDFDKTVIPSLYSGGSFQLGSADVALQGGKEYILTITSNNIFSLSTKNSDGFVDQDFVNLFPAGTHKIAYTPSADVTQIEAYVPNTASAQISINIQAYSRKLIIPSNIITTSEFNEIAEKAVISDEAYEVALPSGGVFQLGSTDAKLQGGKEYHLTITSNNTFSLTSKNADGFVDQDFVNLFPAGTHTISYTPSADVTKIEIYVPSPATITKMKITIQTLGYVVKDGEKITNPLNIKGADPCLIKGNDGLIYMFTTHTNANNISIHRSGNLVSWEYLGELVDDEMMQIIKAESGFDAFGVWAADVIKHNDIYIAYVSVSNTNNWQDARIMAFTSSDLAGRWMYRSIVTSYQTNGTGTGCIDAEVVRDSEGKLNMFFGSYGGIFLTELTDDGLASKGEYQRISAGDGSTEGAVVFFRKGYYYLIASRGGTSPTGNYRLVVTRSKTLKGGFVDKSGNAFVESENNSELILSSAIIAHLVPSLYAGATYQLGSSDVELQGGKEYLLTVVSNNSFSLTSKSGSNFVDRDFVNLFPAGTHVIPYTPSANVTAIEVYIPNTTSTQISISVANNSDDKSPAMFLSPGHCSEPIQDKNLRYWIAYHANIVGQGDVRKILFQELRFDSDGWPYFTNSGYPQQNVDAIPKL